MNEDVEKNLYEIYGKLQKENLLESWKKFSNGVMKYFEKEWGYDNPPTLEEIASVSENFAENDQDMKKIKNLFGIETHDFLLSFMIAGFDVIIHGEV